MNLTNVLLDLGDWVLLAGLPGLILFIVYYFTQSSWRTFLAGRTLMYLSIALLGIFVVVLLTLFLGDNYLGREIVRLAVYGGVSFTVWRLFFTLRKIQATPVEKDFGQVELDIDDTKE